MGAFLPGRNKSRLRIITAYIYVVFIFSITYFLYLIPLTALREKCYFCLLQAGLDIEGKNDLAKVMYSVLMI